MNKNIVYKNKTIAYEVMGEGSPVMFIHGVPVDSRLWENQLAYFKNHYRLILPDLPGSGKSDLLDDMSIDAMADATKALLEAEQINEVVLIGHSMGGYIGVALADKYPDKIKALGFFHSSAYADSEEKKEARKKNIAFIQKHGSLEFIKQSTPGLFSETFRNEQREVVDGIIERYKSANPDALAAYQQAMMDRFDRRQILEQIVKPVLFIIGEHDKAIPFQDSMQQCHVPPLSYIHILKNSGHMGMLEEVEKCNNILEMFFKDVM